MTKVWTDYPIVELGDAPERYAPIRQCLMVSYDGDKYATVKVRGVPPVSVKAGYLYSARGRGGSVPAVSPKYLMRYYRGGE